MIQLILDDIVLPETSKDKYACYPVELSQEIDMISGRRVREIRGNVLFAKYSYDFMGLELTKKVLEKLRSGAPIPAAVLPDNSTELITSIFWVESFTPPTFAFSKSGVPYWHNLAFTLREVKPHD